MKQCVRLLYLKLKHKNTALHRKSFSKSIFVFPTTYILTVFALNALFSFFAQSAGPTLFFLPILVQQEK